MRRLIAACALALAPAAAHAQFFIEGMLGKTDADLDRFTQQGFTADESDATGALGGGYMFNRFLGVEAGWRELGEATLATPAAASGTVAGQPFNATGAAQVKAEAAGAYFGALFETYYERFDFNARAGMYVWEADLTATGAASFAGQAIPAGGAVRSEDDGIDPYVGLGVSYRLTERLSAGASWTRFRILDELDVDAWDLRLRFLF